MKRDRYTVILNDAICVGAVVSPGSIDTRLLHPGHDLRTFKCKHRPLPNSDSVSPMPSTTTMRAQSELVGKAVILSDEKSGRVESVWLGLRHRFP
jgi:hypothetical protein